MKHIALSCILLFVLSTVHAQKDSIYQAFINKKYGTSYIQLSERQQHQAPALFHEIQVVDSRRDTSRLGLSTVGLFKTQLRFQAPVGKTIASFLNRNFTNPKEGRSLLVVIKDLWLFDDRDTTLEENFRKEPGTRRKGNMECRLEAYQQMAGEYLPVTYIDTILSSHDFNAPDMGELILPRLLTSFMEKVSGADMESLGKRRRLLPYNTIDSFNRSRYNYAMDTALVWKKGVYRNVDEFLNNNPSITDYKVERTKMKESSLYVREGNGEYIYTRDVWGYCDGDSYFAMMDGSLFQIFPVQHSFYSLGSKAYSHLPRLRALDYLSGTSALVYGSMRTNETITKKLALFRLDIRSGEFIP